MKKYKKDYKTYSYNNSNLPNRQSRMPRKKKALGQHFLRKHSTVDNMINRVKVTPETTIMEIGCGDGFLTSAILDQTNCKKLLCYEIDPEWAAVVRRKILDPRLEIIEKNILDVTLNEISPHVPLVILANLPYQITFPIFSLFQRNKHLIQEGVVMTQEEVAQKIVASHGKPYSVTSLFLQHHFDVELMEKVEPGAFSPPPKVFSRLLYFKPKKILVKIPNEELFWKFLKLCFKFPRRTLLNNLKSTHYKIEDFSSELLSKRAQQLTFKEFLDVWNFVKTLE